MKMKVKGSKYTFIVDEKLGRQCEELIREFNMFNIEEILYGHFCEIYDCEEDVECNKECYECEDRCKDDYDKCIDRYRNEQRKCYEECETGCESVYRRRRYLEECIKDCKKKCDEKYNRRECEDSREKCLKACESVCECTDVIEVRVG